MRDLLAVIALAVALAATVLLILGLGPWIDETFRQMSEGM